MTAPRWLVIGLVVIVGAAVILWLGRGLAAMERRGWIRLHGVGKGSAAVAFSAMEDMFSVSHSQARQLLEAQKLVGHAAPTPGDGLKDRPAGAGTFAGRLTLPAPIPGSPKRRGSPAAPSSLPITPDLVPDDRS